MRSNAAPWPKADGHRDRRPRRTSANARVIYPALASSNTWARTVWPATWCRKTPLGLVSMRISLQKTYESVASFRNQRPVSFEFFVHNQFFGVQSVLDFP